MTSNSASSCIVPKKVITVHIANYRMFRTLTLNCLRKPGIDAQTPFFCCQIQQWAQPLFLYYLRSLFLRVWCLIIGGVRVPIPYSMRCTVLLLVPWQSWLSWWRWSGTPTTLVCGPSDRLAMPRPLPLQTVAQWRTADCLRLAALCVQQRSGQTPSAERHVHIMKNCGWKITNVQSTTLNALLSFIVSCTVHGHSIMVLHTRNIAGSNRLH